MVISRVIQTSLAWIIKNGLPGIPCPQVARFPYVQMGKIIEGVV